MIQILVNEKHIMTSFLYLLVYDSYRMNNLIYVGQVFRKFALKKNLTHVKCKLNIFIKFNKYDMMLDHIFQVQDHLTP